MTAISFNAVMARHRQSTECHSSPSKEEALKPELNHIESYWTMRFKPIHLKKTLGPLGSFRRFANWDILNHQKQPQIARVAWGCGGGGGLRHSWRKRMNRWTPMFNVSICFNMFQYVSGWTKYNQIEHYNMIEPYAKSPTDGMAKRASEDSNIFYTVWEKPPKAKQLHRSASILFGQAWSSIFRTDVMIYNVNRRFPIVPLL